ncbi:nucleotidyltransferase [Lacibacter luteus]|uniref:Nucleotidyltransferase n=1 Tax=Lacibacter luteus TaxID=2508719 RepID=A0A4Q1CGD2_9BACT|nr:nucleotidyltransferase [Lacibacter luteus]RXK59208.1 nucleotidyltransferase [Lacibacter luteus]
MEAGLNNHLRKISSELFIKYNAEERQKIDRSINSIIGKLDNYFDNQIDEAIVFGSYTRDTILPRRFDSASDIDILIQFNTTDFDKLKPETYRNHLKRFAETNYTASPIIKDHPSIVIELGHIKFDLVPAIFDVGLIYDSIEIPDKNGGWLETEPDKFNDTLTEANTNYNSIVKPIIRLLKYWNASNGYPFFSFELETEVVDMNFSDENYQSGFLYAIEELSGSDLPGWASSKLDVLKTNAGRIDEYLDHGDLQKAKSTLERILPGFS